MQAGLRAFTLIELLVVIAIFAILAAMPSAGAGGRQIPRAGCELHGQLPTVGRCSEHVFQLKFSKACFPALTAASIVVY